MGSSRFIARIFEHAPLWLFFALVLAALWVSGMALKPVPKTPKK
jgi:hypothetical protein